jgi:ATP phosphoribosyltransferase regulatory subunit HisZ
VLNVLSYLIHGIQDVADEEYRKARGSFGRLDAFFRALRYEMSRYLHEDWTDFLLTIAGEAPDDS